MRKYDIAYRFREAFGHPNFVRPGEKKYPVDKLFSNLKEVKITSAMVGYTSIAMLSGFKTLKLHCRKGSGKKKRSIDIWVNSNQEVIKQDGRSLHLPGQEKSKGYDPWYDTGDYFE